MPPPSTDPTERILTLKAQRVIGACPVCLYAGSLVPAEVVACAPEGAQTQVERPLLSVVGTSFAFSGRSVGDCV